MKVVIFAPFWGQTGHIGVYRVERFVRWIKAAGGEVVLVRAGSVDRVEDTKWGTEVTIADPLKLYVERESQCPAAFQSRKPNRLRRFVAYLAFNPDPTIVWARRAAHHQLVRKSCNRATWVLSSNPPESSHVGASILAKELNAQLIVDMRDGWIDEPLRPLLKASRLLRWREGRLEYSVLRRARRIFVTSAVWKEMLESRRPFTRGKTVTLTNAYPNLELSNSRVPRRQPRRLSLLHAGRFGNSNTERRPSSLLKPFHDALTGGSPRGELLLIGDLHEQDLADLEPWRKRLLPKGWEVHVRPPLPHQDIVNALAAADGHLLLSSTYACIPCKLFDYIYAGRPILAATLRDSAVWKIGETVPQMFVFDHTGPGSAAPIRDYLEACQTGEFKLAIPSEHSEESLSRTFLEQLLPR